ncbi:MAG: hypothetical protein JWL81_2208 [Verrucomicrobiales bacterium]|nr:hypothetical protein [Verrucomicrobiales bacterium]
MLWKNRKAAAAQGTVRSTLTRRLPMLLNNRKAAAAQRTVRTTLRRLPILYAKGVRDVSLGLPTHVGYPRSDQQTWPEPQGGSGKSSARPQRVLSASSARSRQSKRRRNLTRLRGPAPAQGTFLLPRKRRPRALFLPAPIRSFTGAQRSTNGSQNKNAEEFHNKNSGILKTGSCSMQPWLSECQ